MVIINIQSGTTIRAIKVVDPTEPHVNLKGLRYCGQIQFKIRIVVYICHLYLYIKERFYFSLITGFIQFRFTNYF